MPEYSRSDGRQGGRNDGQELGASFEASNTPSFSGDLGSSFEESNRGTKEHPGRAWLWIALIVLVVLGVFLVHHFSGDTTSKSGGKHGSGGATSITIGKTTTGDMPVYVEALGTVTPTSTITLYSQVTGRVLSVHYTEGQLVRKGQTLVDIDPQPYEAALEQAEGSLTHDEGVLAEAQMDLKRYEAAAAANAIARQQLEDQQKLVIQEQGTVEADKGTVQGDKVQLAYCHIVAPISGRVGLRLVDPGNTVFSGSSSTLVVITALQPITVVFNVSEDELPAVQTQLQARNVLQVDAFDRSDDNVLESGKLTALDNQIDTATGTVKFRAMFPNKNFNLFPNQFVNARLLLKTLKNVTLVPNAAVQHDGTTAFVYLVKKDAKGGETVAVQDVTVETNDDKNTAVTGIDGGVTVATSGFDRLDPGSPVQAKTPKEKKGAASQGAAGQGTTGQGAAAATPTATSPAGDRPGNTVRADDATTAKDAGKIHPGEKKSSNGSGAPSK